MNEFGREKVEIGFVREPGASDIPLPQYMTSMASGLDLPAAVDGEVTLGPGEYRMISTGLRLIIPPGYEGQVRPRSGLAARYGVTLLNSPGTIDADYRGVVHVVLINLGPEAFTIHRGDRIAQIVFSRVIRAEFKEISEIPETDRGEGGFGHTGMPGGGLCEHQLMNCCKT